MNDDQVQEMVKLFANFVCVAEAEVIPAEEQLNKDK